MWLQWPFFYTCTKRFGIEEVFSIYYVRGLLRGFRILLIDKESYYKSSFVNVTFLTGAFENWSSGCKRLPMTQGSSHAGSWPPPLFYRGGGGPWIDHIFALGTKSKFWIDIMYLINNQIFWDKVHPNFSNRRFEHGARRVSRFLPYPHWCRHQMLRHQAPSWFRQSGTPIQNAIIGRSTINGA